MNNSPGDSASNATSNISDATARAPTNELLADGHPRKAASPGSLVATRRGVFKKKPAIAVDASNTSRWVIRVLCLGLVLLVVWSAFAKIDQVTRTSAQIIAEERTQIIQSPDGGVVTRVHVKEGDAVKAGQLLVTLQKERVKAAVADTTSKVAALKISLARLQAEVYEKPLVFSKELLSNTEYIRNQTDLYRKRKTAIDQDLASLSSILKLAQTELKINEKLEASGDVSQADILRLKRSVADIQAQISSKRNKYLQDTQAEMTKTQEELSTQVEQLRDRTQLLDQTELFAPVAGIVNNIRVTTVGGVVRAGDTVLELLPTSGRLLAEAKVSPTDIAFVEIGQSANINLDAYDSSIFGSMKGQVIYISPDVLTEETRQGPMSYYRVRIAINNPKAELSQEGGIRLKAGLTASVEIKAKERTVLSYLTKPISKTFSKGLGER
jgi:adhesin transport system membrane fusion protein